MLGGSSTSADGANGAQNTVAVPSQLPQTFSLADLQANLQAMAMDFKASFSAAITEIQADIQGIAGRTGVMEQTTARHADALKQVKKC